MLPADDVHRLEDNDRREEHHDACDDQNLLLFVGVEPAPIDHAEALLAGFFDLAFFLDASRADPLAVVIAERFFGNHSVAGGAFDARRAFGETIGAVAINAPVSFAVAQAFLASQIFSAAAADL